MLAHPHQWEWIGIMPQAVTRHVVQAVSHDVFCVFMDKCGIITLAEGVPCKGTSHYSVDCQLPQLGTLFKALSLCIMVWRNVSASISKIRGVVVAASLISWCGTSGLSKMSSIDAGGFQETKRVCNMQNSVT